LTLASVALKGFLQGAKDLSARCWHRHSAALQIDARQARDPTR